MRQKGVCISYKALTGHESISETLAFTLSEMEPLEGFGRGVPPSDLDCNGMVLPEVGCREQCGSSFGSNPNGR